MTGTRWQWWVGTAVVLGLLAGPRLSLAKDDPGVTRINRETERQQAEMNRKLDEIANDQQQILEQLSKVLEELQIVKIRATMR